MTYTPAVIKHDFEYLELTDVRIVNGLGKDDTTFRFSKPVLKHDGTQVTKAIRINIFNDRGERENTIVPAGNLSVDGLEATGVIRGVREDGTDYTTSDPALILEHDGGAIVKCPVSAVDIKILNEVLEGKVATGGKEITMGDGSDGDFAINRKDSGGVKPMFIHKDGKAQYSNDGIDIKPIDDIANSVVVKVSASDTTPKFLDLALEAGENVSFETINPGGNEKIRIKADSKRDGIVEHETYVSAEWEGGNSPESNVALINDITDGSLRFNYNGTNYNVDGVNFTGDITKADVASTLQDAINAIVPEPVVVTWTGVPIVIEGSNTTTDSEINTFTTSTGTVGTDLTTDTWLDLADGTETLRVLNPSEDSGKALLLKPEGDISAKAITGQETVSEDQLIAVDGAGGLKTITPQETDIIHVDSNLVREPGSSSTYDALNFTVPGGTLSKKDVLIDMRNVDCDSVNISIYLGSELLFQENASGSNDIAYFVPIRLSLVGGNDQEPILLTYPDVSEYTIGNALTPTVNTNVDQVFRIEIQGRSSNTGFTSEGAIVYTIPKSI